MQLECYCAAGWKANQASATTTLASRQSAAALAAQGSSRGDHATAGVMLSDQSVCLFACGVLGRRVGLFAALRYRVPILTASCHCDTWSWSTG